MILRKNFFGFVRYTENEFQPNLEEYTESWQQRNTETTKRKKTKTEVNFIARLIFLNSNKNANELINPKDSI